ncbi:N-6 DNA methylase [Glutamicibacter protophormiae]|uniref:N-6 DNA methylase n=1 Tax=Glutamicibacter protophormiae TaxID=37930 RepID=UPI002A7FA250|nr:N-6 DNA methylase [Glutamicibacter protophormiae]WPR65422.1 N-6 DNA methylase [Glutamicibacter protophormiae]WPR68920.1 N-6 DNA methylase [Glutamicibacter protophormiae]
MTTIDDQRLISISGIAELTGLKMPTVSNWRRREDTFPKRVAGSDARPLFSLAEVKDWIVKTGKNVQFKERSAALSLTDLLRAKYSADKYHFVLFPLLALARWTQENNKHSYAETSGKNFVALVKHSIASMSESHPLVADALNQLLTEAESHGTGVLLANTFDKIIDLGNFGQLAEDLTDLIQKTSWKIGGEHLSKPEFSDFLIALLPPGGNDFADFGSGYGQNLSAAARHKPNWSLTGMEINIQANRLAACFLYVNEVEAELISKDLLRAPLEESFDRITFHAPFGLRLTDENLQASAWPFGKPPRTNADTAWPQIAYRSLGHDGVAVVVTATSVLARSGATRDILKRMVSQGAIEAIISLPEKTQANTSLPVSVIVIRKDSTPAEVLMIDVSQLELVTGQNQPGADSASAYAKAISSLEAWRQSGTADHEVSIAVPVAELLAPDAVLLPQRWLLSTGGPADSKHLIENVNATHTALLRTAQKQPEVPAPMPLSEASGVIHHRAVTEIGEVIRGDFYTPKNSANDADTSLKIQVVTMRTVRDGLVEERQANATTNMKKSPVRTQPGDILIATTGTRINACVWDEGGQAVDKNVSIVRGLGSAWDPHFVAFQLTAENNQAMLTGITIKRVDAKQLVIAQLPLEDQRVLGQTFRKFAAVSDTARQTAAMADEHLAALLDAVSSGAVSLAQS